MTILGNLFWVLDLSAINPSATLGDCLFEADAKRLALQVAGGLDLSKVAMFHLRREALAALILVARESSDAFRSASFDGLDTYQSAALEKLARVAEEQIEAEAA